MAAPNTGERTDTPTNLTAIAFGTGRDMQPVLTPAKAASLYTLFVPLPLYLP